MITCVSISGFAGISLVLFYCDFIGSEQHFLPEKIEHLSPLYAVARFNSRQQLFYLSTKNLVVGHAGVSSYV